MSKPRASYYARYGDLIVSATIADTYGPDGVDELRRQVMRGFAECMNYVEDVKPTEGELIADPTATENLPPVE